MVIHDSSECHAVEYMLRCPCGLTVDCSADSDAEACDDIDRWLDGKFEVRCAACRAMP